MTDTFTAFGNHGILTVCATTGLVLDYEPQEDSDYADYYRIDVQEFRGFYGEELAGRMVDVLDLGFTTKLGISYPPEQDWRDRAGWFE